MNQLIVGDLLITDLGRVAVVLDLNNYEVCVGYYRDDLIKYQNITYIMAANANRRFKKLVKDGDK